MTVMDIQFRPESSIIRPTSSAAGDALVLLLIIIPLSETENASGSFILVYKGPLRNNCSIFLVFLPDDCVGGALRSTEYAAVPLPCPPTKIPRNLATFIS